MCDPVHDVETVFRLCNLLTASGNNARYMSDARKIANCSFPGITHISDKISSFCKHFFIETASPFEAKFYVESPWDSGTKVWSIGLGHMTKMAAMPIYGKILKKKSSSLEPKGRCPRKLVWSIGYSSTTKFVQTMTLGWPWLILRQGQIWSFMLLYGKKGKQWIFQTAHDMGLYTCIKALTTGVMWAFTGPLVLWFSFTIIVNPFLYVDSGRSSTEKKTFSA